MSRLSPKDRDVAMVFQSYALYPHLSVRENLAFGLQVRGAAKSEIRAKVEETAGMLGLESMLARMPRELSGGQRQRVAIGRAIVRRPKLFLFDEPLSNLDARLRAEMRVELARLHRRLGSTMIYVTHDQVEAMTLADRIMILAEGEVQQIGRPLDIYQRPVNLFVAGFIGSPAMNLFRGVVSRSPEGVRFRCGSMELDLGAKAYLLDYEDQTITLGVRPEDVTPGQGGLRARVELVERIGPETILYIAADDTNWRVLTRGDFQARVGETINLEPNPDRLHFS